MIAVTIMITVMVRFTVTVYIAITNTIMITRALTITDTGAASSRRPARLLLARSENSTAEHHNQSNHEQERNDFPGHPESLLSTTSNGTYTLIRHDIL